MAGKQSAGAKARTKKVTINVKDLKDLGTEMAALTADLPVESVVGSIEPLSPELPDNPVHTLPGFDASPPSQKLLPAAEIAEESMFPKLKLFQGDTVKDIDDESGIPLSVSAPKHPMIDATALTFDPRIAFALAMELQDPKQICETFDVTEDHFNALVANQEFNATVALYKKELGSNGASFRAKAKLQAEMLLDTSWKLIHNASTPPAVKADLIKYTTKVADLEPKKDSGESAPTFALQINF